MTDLTGFRPLGDNSSIQNLSVIVGNTIMPIYLIWTTLTRKVLNNTLANSEAAGNRLCSTDKASIPKLTLVGRIVERPYQHLGADTLCSGGLALFLYLYEFWRGHVSWPRRKRSDRPRSAGMRFEGGKDIHVERNTIVGFDDGIIARDVENLKALDNEVNSSPSEHDKEQSAGGDDEHKD